MPAILSRLRGLQAAVNPDEPLRKAEAVTGGALIDWRNETASTTLVIGDAGNGVTINSGADVTLTVPLQVDVAFTGNVTIIGVQLGAGKITVSGPGGVNIRRRTVFLAKTAGPNAPFTLVRLAPDDWLLSGDLEVAP